MEAQLNATPSEENQARDLIQQQIDDLVGYSNVGTAISNKTGYELIDLEEAVTLDEGCWVKFMKTPIPQAENEDPKSKKGAPKGKGAAPTEELKPVFARGWVSFKDINRFGQTEVKQRVYL